MDMEIIKVGIRHTGSQAVIVRTIDGSITVQPGDKLKDQEILALSEGQVDLYKTRGVRFSGLPKPKDDACADIAALTKAVEEARAKHEQAKAAAEKAGAGANEAKAVKEAADVLAAAEAALAEAAT